jgi:hypothetical protein
MILNANKNTKKFNDTINRTVGEKYSFLESFKLGGIGSGQLRVIEWSKDLTECFGENLDIKFVIIELRKKGVIVYIKNYINNFIWIIPYRQLSIFKSDYFSLHSNGNFIKIDLNSVEKRNKAFLKKLQIIKTELSDNTF